MTECLQCGATTRDVWLCGTHVGVLRTMLREAPALAGDLAVTTARQDRMGRSVGSSGKGGPKPGIVNFDAAAVLADLRLCLTGWAARISTGPNSIPSAAHYLTAAIPAMLPTQAIGFLYQNLADVTRGARLIIDIPLSREGYDYAGPCGAKFEEATRTIVCGNQLWVAHGQAMTFCHCCGTEWNVTIRRDDALAAAVNMLATADAISRALTSAGRDVTANMIYHYKNRGRLIPAGTNKAKQPLYRVGDVLDIVEGKK